MYDSMSHCAPGYLFQYLGDVRHKRYQVSRDSPSSTKITSLFNQSEVGDALLKQSDSHQLSAITSANNNDVEVQIDRVTLKRLAVWVSNVMGEGVFDKSILIDATILKTLVSLGQVFLSERNRVKT